MVAPQVTLNYATGSGFEFVLDGQSVMLMHPELEVVSPRLAEGLELRSGFTWHTQVHK